MIEEIIITTIAPEGSPVLVAMTASDAVAYSMWQHNNGAESNNLMTKRMPKILCNWLSYGFYLRKNALGYTAYPNPAPSVNIAISQIHSAVQNYGLGMGLIKISSTGPTSTDMPPTHLVRYLDKNKNQKYDSGDTLQEENWLEYVARSKGESITASTIYQYNCFKGVNKSLSKETITYSGTTYKLDSGYISTSASGSSVKAGPADSTKAWSLVQAVDLNSPEYYYFVGYVDPKPKLTIEYVDQDGNKLLASKSIQVIEGAKGGISTFFKGEPQETVKYGGAKYNLVNANITIGGKTCAKGNYTAKDYLATARSLTGDTVYTLIYEKVITVTINRVDTNNKRLKRRR